MSLLERTLALELIIADRWCGVVGDGHEIHGKIERILAGSGRVRWFVEAPDPALAQRVRARGEVHGPAPDLAALADLAVVFFATDQEPLGRALLAARPAALISVLDRPESSTFINPACAQTSGLRLSISSGGVAPSLVKRLRRDLERILADGRLAELVARAAELRPRLPRGERGAEIAKLFEGVRLSGRLEFRDDRDSA